MRPNRSGPLWISLAAAVVAALVLLGLLRTVAGALFTGNATASDVSTRMEALLAKHEELQSTHEARFNGRSVFFIPRIERPAPPPRPRTEPEPRDPEPVVEREPLPPPPPRTYTGPGVIGFDPTSVYFDNGTRIRIGEEAEGIEVLGVDPPWHVELAYRGWSGKVPVFVREWDEKLLKGKDAFAEVSSSGGGSTRFNIDEARERAARNAAARNAARRTGPPE